MSEQLSSLTSTESPNVELASDSSQGVFGWFERASLRTQQLVIASTSGLVASLVLVAVIQIFAKIILQLGNTTLLSQLILISLATLVTATIVGATTFALGLITTNRISRVIDNFQAQFNALAEGNLGVRSTVYSTQELGQLAMSFNKMAEVLNTRLSEAQRKADEQEKIKEDLQEQLIQLIHQDLEESFDIGATVQPEEIITEENEQITNPQEKIIDLIVELNNITRFRESINPNLLLSTTTLAEIQQHKNELEYRKSWLKALIEETQRELNYLTLLIHSNEQDRELSN
ncbi:MAG TPA: HAMP domain-containing protein [Chroococcales cyanobacterium]